MPIVVNGVTLPEYADPADVPAALRNMANGMLPLAGGTMTGIIAMGGQRITGLGSGINPTDAVTKQYVDAAVANVTWGALVGKPATFPVDPHTHAYAPSSHVTSGEGFHDNRYYTEGEAEQRNQDWLGAHSGTGAHDWRYYTRGDVDWLLGHYLYTQANNNTYVHGNIIFPGYLYLNQTEINRINSNCVFPATIYVNYAEIQHLWTPSSLDYKSEVAPVQLEQSLFEKLNPISFRFNKDYPRYEQLDNPEAQRMGFSYEDIVEIAPQWAVENEGDKGVSYLNMLPDFMAWVIVAIKDLRDKLPPEDDDGKVAA